MPQALAREIASWLSNRQDLSSGRIVDSAHQVSGTYADGFAALTFTLLEQIPERDRALEVSLGRSSESEFDGLAQALILTLAPETLTADQALRLRNKECHQGNALVSNNWALFRALTRGLRQVSPADFRLVDRQLSSGLFPDSPVGQATPVCYHAKICATLALQCILVSENPHKKALRQGLTALAALVSPTGILVPYGRSRNTLFAYGSAYLALRLGALLFRNANYAGAAEALLENMSRHRASDGHIPAVLNDQEWLRKDWDIYINNPDYNAYAAACLLLAEKLAPEIPPAARPDEGVSDLGPILVVRRADGYFACSTTGEFAPHGSPFFCDTRYAGLSPLLFDDGKDHRLFDQNYCWDGRDSTRTCLVDPTVSDWIPFVVQDNRRFWVRNFEQVTWTLEDGRLQVTGTGKLGCSRPIPRWQRFLVSRVMRRPAPQMTHQELHVRLTSKLRFDFQTKQVCLESAVHDSQASLQRANLREVLEPS